VLDDSFVDLDEAAKRMKLTTSQVMELVNIRALRAVHLGLGEVWVQPAVVNRTPRP
jgi:hypothetical protein